MQTYGDSEYDLQGEFHRIADVQIEVVIYWNICRHFIESVDPVYTPGRQRRERREQRQRLEIINRRQHRSRRQVWTGP